MAEKKPKHTDTTHNLLYLKGGGPGEVSGKKQRKKLKNLEKLRKTVWRQLFIPKNLNAPKNFIVPKNLLPPTLYYLIPFPRSVSPLVLLSQNT